MDTDFKKIDLNSWDRKENYIWFTKHCPCGINMTSNIEITDLLSEMKNLQLRCYATFSYMITKILNAHDEFKTIEDNKGDIITFNRVHVRYPLFNNDNKKISILWTEYSDSFKVFYDNFLNDCEKYGAKCSMTAKGSYPANIFDFSCVPWVSFTSLNCDFDVNKIFHPFIAIGKFFEQNEKILLPVSIKVHHALCDGYHVSRFFEELQLLSKNFKSFIYSE